MKRHHPDPKSPSSPQRSRKSRWDVSDRNLSISTTDSISPLTLETSPWGSTTTEAEFPVFPESKITFHDRPSFHPQFIPLLLHLSARLRPLVNVVTGRTHPDFPQTMLAYNLLTMEQCDGLARHFHQVWPPVPASFHYPVYITPWIGTPEEETTDLPTRLRRLGRFFGLRGCESPIAEGFGDMDFDYESVDYENTECEEIPNMSTEEAELLRQMEVEWQQALQRAYAEEAHRWNLK
ncbi:uncharacterized protein N7515_008397 [Penicillium bovifimosum]|uniref:Uncharacterized protein n=1 Tax=Penicillium bovifimosum TaxID=126998 RepID=A0A9W9KXG6_9EURO|nr:uncharacterized protein N7515_008397 [Penicillium bovifimosum]KAJ5124572.1 hypothetical protein N7515_008397 [Penicillium bovifimosum]